MTNSLDRVQIGPGATAEEVAAVVLTLALLTTSPSPPPAPPRPWAARVRAHRRPHPRAVRDGWRSSSLPS
jgi:hypothetical protein